MSNILSLISMLLCLAANIINSHGFDCNTLVVLADKNLQHIETVCKRSLRKPIRVSSYDTNNNILLTNSVIQSGRSTALSYVRFGFNSCFEYSSHNEIACTSIQEFYLAATQVWIPAYALKVGDKLTCAHNKVKTIAYLQYIEQPLTVYTLEIDKTHTFFVSSHAVLTHNMVLPLAFSIGLSVPIGSATTGAVASMFGPIVCTFGAAIGTVIGVCATLVYDDVIPKYTIVNDPDFHRFYNNDAQAPGKPTEKDGYIPPKRWDGKKVKSPNGHGYGWPDHKGSIWIPTGPGSAAHGGPHWDVQHPNGNYENIMPGGHVRGKK